MHSLSLGNGSHVEAQLGSYSSNTAPFQSHRHRVFSESFQTLAANNADIAREFTFFENGWRVNQVLSDEHLCPNGFLGLLKFSRLLACWKRSLACIR